MNRCLHRPHGLALGLATLLIGISSLLPEVLLAQEMARQFPPAARRGTFEVVAPPNVLINDQAERLSPGARIKNPNNMIVLSGTLVGQPLLVNYLREPHGLIHEVWILSPAEAQQERPDPR